MWLTRREASLLGALAITPVSFCSAERPATANSIARVAASAVAIAAASAGVRFTGREAYQSMGALAKQKGDPHPIRPPCVRDALQLGVGRQVVEAIRLLNGATEPRFEQRQVIRVPGAAQEDQLGAERSDARQ